MFLVTGAAGFIGFHVSQRLLKDGFEVYGIDNINNYYDPALKHARLAQLQSSPGFRFEKLDVADRTGMEKLFRTVRPKKVIHLAAQAGVRYSLENPHAYVDSNLHGFINILEGCRHFGVEHLVYASSSSVYGSNTKMPFSVDDNVDHPLSLYAATKKANELMAHTYSHLYNIPTTGLRFFTVYGPWGRPDMALFLFTEAILNNRPINVFNYGKMQRDFTYIDDIVEGVLLVSEKIPARADGLNAQSDRPGSSSAPYRIYNIGNNQPAALLDLIKMLEDCLGRTAQKNYLPMQPGDVPATFADISEISRDTGFLPATPIQEGIRLFARWYCDIYIPMFAAAHNSANVDKASVGPSRCEKSR